MSRKRVLIGAFAMLLASPWCRADEKSDIAVSFRQIQQLSKHVSDFWRRRDGQLPKTFAELLEEKPSDKKLLISPLAEDQTKASYELLTPAEKITQVPNATRTVLIRSLFKTKDGKRMVAFADGHVEMNQE